MRCLIKIELPMMISIFVADIALVDKLTDMLYCDDNEAYVIERKDIIVITNDVHIISSLVEKYKSDTILNNLLNVMRDAAYIRNLDCDKDDLEEMPFCDYNDKEYYNNNYDDKNNNY